MDEEEEEEEWWPTANCSASVNASGRDKPAQAPVFGTFYEVGKKKNGFQKRESQREM